MIDSIAKAFQEGGLFMYFIAMGSAFSAAVTLERGVQLFFRLRAGRDETFEPVLAAVDTGKVDSEVEESFADSAAPLHIMASHVLRAVPYGPRAILDAVSESHFEVAPTVSERIGYISMLANVSTLLGLLGTIVGLIAAFAGVAAADPAQKQQMLATGISVAMNTTAYGLMVAIPGMLSYSILMSRANALMSDIEMFEHKIYAHIGIHHPAVMDYMDEIGG